jgi:predicted acyltransferase
VPRPRKAWGILAVGIILIGLGEWLGWWFPINKKIWSSSYVVAMAGWASAFLAGCYSLVDVRGWRWGTPPALVLGTNAILSFFGSSLMARLVTMIRWGEGDAAMSVKKWTWQLVAGPLGETALASMVWGVAYLGLRMLLMTPLYRKRIFLKV